ncbi:MAG: hypothetical protein ABIR68_05790 [Ilumatobacteraceae bacterium]
MVDVSRRQVIGLGAAASAGLAWSAMPSKAAASPLGTPSGGFGSGAGTSSTEVLTVEDALTPGLDYITIDPSAFHPYQSPQGRAVSSIDGVGVLDFPGGLMAPIDVPFGAVIKEITLFFLAAAATPVHLSVWRKPFGGPYVMLTAPPTGLTLPVGPAIQSTVVALDEPADGTASHMILLDGLTNANQKVHGARVGYVPVAPRPAFVPISPIQRPLDTRTTGGKLQPTEERVVVLGVPGTASAAVINLTVTDTQLGGYVSVFPADANWNGNSSINWATSGAILANGVITAIDPAGAIKIRGAINPTHVVIDVQGYLL